MDKLGAALVASLATLAVGAGDGPAVVPRDFKVMVESFALRKEPVLTEEIVVLDGRAYLFPSDLKEVVIIDAGRDRLEILDVGRKVRAEVSFRALDESLEKLKATLGEAADRRKKLGGRGNAIEARMTRDLFETGLDVVDDPKIHQVRLSNPAVEVTAVGEPEADKARLALVATTLATLAKLGAYRSPSDLPPFAELQAIASLTGERKLRPTELSYLYRLAGPPRKFRRTYRLVPTLTDREIEAIARVDRLVEAVPTARLERYRQGR